MLPFSNFRLRSSNEITQYDHFSSWNLTLELSSKYTGLHHWLNCMFSRRRFSISFFRYLSFGEDFHFFDQYSQLWGWNHQLVLDNIGYWPTQVHLNRGTALPIGVNKNEPECFPTPCPGLFVVLICVQPLSVPINLCLLRVIMVCASLFYRKPLWMAGNELSYIYIFIFI